MVNCEGWTCPTCRRNYAPWMPSCNCINSAVGVSTTSITITPHADDTAELIAALEAWLAWAAKHQADLYFSDLPESSFTQVGDLVVTSRAVLARVKGGER